MPSKLDFRRCVHQGVAGPTPDDILASIRAEYCLPREALPIPRRDGPPTKRGIRLEDFTALARAVGPDAFRQLTADLLRRGDPVAQWAHLPAFLSRHRYGRATPALIDLARLECAVAAAEVAPAAESIGPCCLPVALLRAHPDLTLALHPAWHWLDLAYPADRWRAALLVGAEAIEAPPPHRVRLRVHPQGESVGLVRLGAREFAFEQALRKGDTLRQAAVQARHADDDNNFDALAHLRALAIIGAITGVALHPSTNSAPSGEASGATTLPTHSKEMTS